MDYKANQFSGHIAYTFPCFDLSQSSLEHLCGKLEASFLRPMYIQIPAAETNFTKEHLHAFLD